MIVTVLWTIFWTIIYICCSTIISFKLTDLIDDGPNSGLDVFVKHFLVWPVECLFLLIFFIGYKLGLDKTKTKNHK